MPSRDASPVRVRASVVPMTAPVCAAHMCTLKATTLCKECDGRVPLCLYHWDECPPCAAREERKAVRKERKAAANAAEVRGREERVALFKREHPWKALYLGRFIVLCMCASSLCFIVVASLYSDVGGDPDGVGRSLVAVVLSALMTAVLYLPIRDVPGEIFREWSAF